MGDKGKFTMNQSKLQDLANEMISLHNFHYKTLQEAKKIIQCDDYTVCFDALSLAVYQHNLPPKEYAELCSKLKAYYWTIKNSEEIKERGERYVLLRFLELYKAYSDYVIIKKVRPDFVLQNDKKNVGIEVVQLTRPQDQVLNAISREYFGKGMNAKEIESAAVIKHGKKARQYSYYDLDNTGGEKPIVAIGTGTYDCQKLHQIYAGKIVEKIQMYTAIATVFDDFIILCNALVSPAVDSPRDIDAIRISCKESENNNGIRVVILYEDDSLKPVMAEFQ